MIVAQLDIEGFLGRRLTEFEVSNLALYERMFMIALSAHKPPGAGPLDAWLAGLDQSTLSLVAAEAIARWRRHPDAAKETAVQIDDGRIEKKHTFHLGRIEITPFDLSQLGITSQSQAFSFGPS